MADVYLAHDTLLGREVALKLLHHRFAEDQEFVERFRREASSAAGLSHPNVVAVFDRGEWDGTYYIAMEYLPGRSLKAVVREHGPLSPLGRDRHRRADPACRPLRPSARHHPPRHQAPQRDPRRGGAREGDRLRDRARRRLGHDADRLDHGHRAVPLARAGPGARRQRDLRPVRGRRRPLRAADRQRAVRGGLGGEHRAQAGLGRADPAEPAQSRGEPRARRGRDALARKGSQRALRERRRAHRGAATGAPGDRAARIQQRPAWPRRRGAALLVPPLPAEEPEDPMRAARRRRRAIWVAAASRCSPSLAAGALLLLAVALEKWTCRRCPT